MHFKMPMKLPTDHSVAKSVGKWSAKLMKFSTDTTHQ